MAKKTLLDLERALEAMEIGDMDVIVRKRLPRHFRPLMELLSLDPDVDPNHRQRAMYALGRWQDPAVAARILELLPGLDEAEMCTALDSLGRLGSREALGAIDRCAEDPSPHVRKFAVRALGEIGGADAEKRLRKISREDPERWVRDVTLRVLEARGDVVRPPTKP